MQPRLCVIGISAILFLARGVHASGASDCPSAQSSRCGNHCNTVVEMPKKIIGLAGESFVLGSLPVSSSDVHIYVSGLELVPEKDFHVAGQSVTFLKKLASETTGTTLVRYESQFGQAIPEVCSTLDITDLVVRTALTRAALATVKDASTLSAPSDRTPSEESATRTQDRSLRLLARTLKTQSAAPRIKVATSKKRQSSVVQGVDGQGDDLLESGYSVLGEDVLPGIDGFPSSERELTAEPRALRMLRQSLTKSGAQ